MLDRGETIQSLADKSNDLSDSMKIYNFKKGQRYSIRHQRVDAVQLYNIILLLICCFYYLLCILRF